MSLNASHDRRPFRGLIARGLHRALGLLGCCLIAACAARTAAPPAPATPLPDLTAADQLADEGCYRCLGEAFAIAERLADSTRMFRTALLLAMREKELGLEATPWLDRARALATPDTRVYLDIVSSLPWTSVAGAPDFEPPARPSQATVDAWTALLKEPGRTSPLERYMRLALSCRRPGDAPDASVIVDRPLLQYRLGACTSAERGLLDTVLTQSPRFAEAGFLIARYESLDRSAVAPQISRALPLLLMAHETLPESPLITVTLANTWRARSEYARALALYDEALARRPTQRDALLGRAMTLTYLGRAPEAIAAATTMIELGTWYMGDAYYWRAWNLYNTGPLDAAAADVVEAKRFQNGYALLTLSGMIAYDQTRPADARGDFETAYRQNRGNCPAIWYLGVLDIDARLWGPARDRFIIATMCYRDAATAAEEEAAQLSADLSPEARTQQTEDYARRIADARRQEARSALNVALLSTQLGDRARATEFARVAVEHPFTRERAQAVLDAPDR